MNEAWVEHQASIAPAEQFEEDKPPQELIDRFEDLLAEARPRPVYGEPKRTTWRANNLNSYPGDTGDIRFRDNKNPNLVSSLAEDGYHYPVLDLDITHKLVPSTTPGHGHLYLNVPLTWEQYEQLLTVLAQFGIIEQGFAELSKERKASFVRLPGVKKEVPAL